MLLKKLLEQRNALAAEMRGMHDKAETEERGFSSEEKSKWEGMKSDLSDLDERVERAKDASADLGDIELPQEQRTTLPGQQPVEQRTDEQTDDEKYSAAFRAYMAGGMSNVTAEQRGLLQERYEGSESRAQSVGTNTAGGFAAHDSLATSIIENMKMFGGMEALATVVTTGTGSDILFPTNDDTGNVGEIVAENAAISEQDTVLGQKNIGAYMYSSKMIRISLQLLQDNQVNLDAFLGRLLGKRLGRIQATHFATGTGSSQPEGILTASTAGATAAAASAITFKDLNALIHSIDPAYRANGMGAFCFNDSTLAALEDLDDADGRPIWRPSLAEGAPATIAGYRYVIDQGYDSIGTGNKVATFGDHSAYMIRRVNGVQMMRLAERYAEYLQVALFGFNRADGALLDTSAVKHLVMA